MENTSYEGRSRYQDPTVADNYDDRRFSSRKGQMTDKKEKQNILTALQRANITGHVLDVPCGTGRMTELLLQQGLRVTAGDISDEMMDHARQRVERYGDKVDFVKCDIENLQFPNASFELVLTIRLLHHIPPDMHHGMLSELHRVTRKWVIITYSTKYSLQNLRRNFRSLFTKFPRYSISPRLFKREVAEAGFDIVEYLPMMPVVSESITVLLRKRE
jgi:ubiquinone/menaquinone biosynthesis C-methylase UbiE